MLDVLAGHDPNDQGSAKAPKVDYGAACHRPIKGMRIALARSWHEGKTSVTPEMAKGDRRGGARAEGSRRHGRRGRLPRHPRLSHLRPRHHHRRGARHPSPGGDRDAGEVRLHDAPALPARRFPDAPSSTLGAALPPQAHARYPRGDARLRPRHDAPTTGARRKSSRSRSRSSTSSASPRSPCRSMSPASPRSRCAAASAATAFRSPSSSPAAPSTRLSVFAAGSAYERVTTWRTSAGRLISSDETKRPLKRRSSSPARSCRCRRRPSRPRP